MRLAKLGFILIGVGVLLGIQGCRLMTASGAASAEPAAVTLTDVEGGKGIEDRYVTIGEHVALYEKGVESRGYFIYPIASLDAVGGKVPEEDIFIQSGCQRAKVLVRESVSEHRFVPPAELVDSVTGLIMSTGKELNYDDYNQLKGRMGVSDLDHLVVVDSGRKPAITMAILMLVGAAVCFFGGAGWVAWVLHQSTD